MRLLPRTIKRLLIFAIVSAPLVSATEDETMIVNYGQIEFGSKLPYHEELLHRILDITQDDFGPYQLNIFPEARNWSIARYRRELTEGDTINLSWGATSDYTPENIGHLRINYPFMKNVNGYRLLFIRQQDRNKFKNVKSITDIRKLTAGQNRGWVETDIFAHNHMPLIESVVMKNLYGMLSRQRFDYLPLAVLEMNEEFKKYHESYPDIVIEDSLLLYYPSPLYFQVSHKFPKLAERMTAGMKHLVESGELDRIFNKHFAAEIASFNLDARRPIIMANPYIPKDSQDTYPRLLKSYH